MTLRKESLPYARGEQGLHSPPIFAWSSWTSLPVRGLSLLLVHYSTPRAFPSGYSGFPLSSKLELDLDSVDERATLWRNQWLIPIIIIIFFLLLLLRCPAQIKFFPAAISVSCKCFANRTDIHT